MPRAVLADRSAPPAAAAGARRRAPSLAEAFDPRHNALGALRVGLALVVAVAHASAVAYGDQPSLGPTDVADLAVDAFFVISGFLVTASLLRLPTLRRYAWHRFLRIMPGFWVCLVVTAVVAAPLAAVLDGRTPGSVFTAAEDPAWRYALVNAALPILQYGIAGLGEASGAPPEVFDGSLWTLQYEAACYVLVAALALVVGLRRRRWPVLALCAAVWAAAVVGALGGPVLDPPALDPREAHRFALAFLLGAVGHLYADRIRLSGPLALLGAGSVLVGVLVLPEHELLAAPGLAYLCLWAAARLPLPEPRWDLSYGIYIYHWPVQLLLALAGAQALGRVPFTALSIALATGVAAGSWLLVERPALRLKDARWVDGR